MKQVYLDQIIDVNDTLALDSKQAHHIFDVLRTSSKEKIRIVTKSSGVFYGHVLDKPKLHIDEKLDVLKEHQVPALFFVTGHFMEQNPELVKRMADEGHIVGNHTWHHPDLAKVNKEKFNEELQLVEDKYKEITGQEMVRYLRPPEGHFNQQMLDWAKERGYYTILWSLAYMDWDVNKQKGADYAYNQILARMHPGAIVLMHSISSDNAECLNKLIPELRNEGYEFKSLQYLMTQDSPVIIE